MLLWVAASSDALPSERRKFGCGFFPRVTLFSALWAYSESIDETNRVAGAKTRTLENRKGAAPATHKQILFQYVYPIR
jgi:hypothetical protein